MPGKHQNRRQTSAYEQIHSGTFHHTKEVNINGSNFAINHNTIKQLQEASPKTNIRKLCDHVSTVALHNSRERSREVSELAVKSIVHEWSTLRLSTLCTTVSNPIPDPSSPPVSPFDRLSVDDALYDIFKWLNDPLTPYLMAWMHDEAPSQTLLLANALVNILHRQRLLSASFFFSSTTDSSSVVPTIAYQLAQNIPQVEELIAKAVGQDLTVFESGCHNQVEQLIVNPLKRASKSCKGFVEAPKIIVIYGLETFDKDETFQASFLDSLSHTMESLETTPFSQRLLLLGRYTDQLQESILGLVSPSKVIQRPIRLHNLLGREHELRQKEKEIEKREDNLAQKEKRITACLEARCRKIKSQEQALRSLEKEVAIKERASINQREDALGLRESRIRQVEEQVTPRSKELEKDAVLHEQALRAFEELAELKAKHEEMEDSVKRRETAIRLQENHVKELEEHVTRRGQEVEAYVASLEQTLRSRERELAGEKEEWDKRMTEVEDLLRRLKGATESKEIPDTERKDVRKHSPLADTLDSAFKWLFKHHDPCQDRQRFIALYGEVLGRCRAIYDAINGQMIELDDSVALNQIEKLLLTSSHFHGASEPASVPDHVTDILEGLQFIKSFFNERKTLMQTLDYLVSDNFKGLTLSFNHDYEDCRLQDDMTTFNALCDYFHKCYKTVKVLDTDIIGRRQQEFPVIETRVAIRKICQHFRSRPPPAELSEIIIKSLMLATIPFTLLDPFRPPLTKALNNKARQDLLNIRVWVSTQSLLDDIVKLLNGLTSLPTIQCKYQELHDLLDQKLLFPENLRGGHCYSVPGAVGDPVSGPVLCFKSSPIRI